MERSDEILVRKTLEGDDSAFSILVNRHRGVVHGLCYHLTHNFTDAEDLAQESDFPSTDVYEVTGKDNDHYYVSHYYYALKQVKT